MVAGSNPVAPTIFSIPPTFTRRGSGASGPDRSLPVVARISHQIADIPVRVLPARAVDRRAVRVARATLALRLPARRAPGDSAA